MGWRRYFRRARWDRDRREEIESYIQIETDDNIARGIPKDEAGFAARRKLGNATLVREEIYRVNTINFVDTICRDVRYACRTMRRSPLFTGIAILTLALGIGANTAIFSVVDTFLIRPLPFPQSDRLLALFERSVGNEQITSVAPGNFLDWQKTAQSFEQMSARTNTIATLANESGAERVFVCNCSGNVFTTLGVPPAIGRAFRSEEDQFGAPRLVIISYGLWQRRYGGSADVIGKAMRLDGADYEIIGVMPRGFIYPNRTTEVWKPFLTGVPPAQQIRHDLHFTQVIARLRPGVSIEQAGAELDGIAARYKSAHPEEATGRGAFVFPLHDQLVRDMRTPLIVLLGAVGCVLLIACVNIANLMLTRAAGRSREIGIRAALGAGRRRIIQQLVTESILIGLAGGAVGALLGSSITGALVAHAPGSATLVPTGNLPVNPAIFLFAFAIAVVTGVAVGLLPAIRVSRTNLAEGLKDSTRSATMTRAHDRLRNLLVSAEVALSLMLLIASGLLLRSFFSLYRVHTGVRVDHTLTMYVTMPFANFREPARRSALLNEIGERIRNLPGVKSAGMVSCPPLTGSCNVLFFYVDGRPFTLGKFSTALEFGADPDYFAAAGIPLLRGRTFTKQDGSGFDFNNHLRLGQIVINESMAKTVFPGEDPIGKRIFFDFEVQQGRNQNMPVPRYEIVGVVGDVPPTLDAQITPTLYRPLLGLGSGAATILLHTETEPHSLIAAARNEIRQIDAGLAVSRIQTLDELVDSTTSDRQFSMLLFVTFAGLALLLAAIGLYGLVSYAVSQRKMEIGVRMALGATAGDVRKLMVFEGLKPAVAGLILGSIGAVFAARILRSQLFGVTPADPLTFTMVVLLLFVVAALACYVPAMRATRLDPTAALRAE